MEAAQPVTTGFRKGCLEPGGDQATFERAPPASQGAGGADVLRRQLRLRVLYIDQTNGLGLDADGYLWARFESIPDVLLGHIEDEPLVPAPMVPERDELLEYWEGPSKEDELREWRSTYRRQSGV